MMVDQASEEDRTVKMMEDERSLFRFILYGNLTLGIYEIWFMHHLARDVNELCRDTGRKTTGVVAYLLLGLLTGGLYCVFWWYRVADMLDRTARKKEVRYECNPMVVMISTLLTYVTGFAGLVGLYYVFDTTNVLAEEYNREQRRRAYYEATPA